MKTGKLSLVILTIISISCNQKREIIGKEYKTVYPDSLLTHIQINPSQMYFDTLELNKKIDTFFVIQNTGKNVFVIDRISPS